MISTSFARCGQVCKSWNEVIQQDECAYSKRRTHRSEADAGLEVRFTLLAQHTSAPEEYSDTVRVCSQSGGAHHVPEAETRLTLLKRSALKTVQAQSRSSSFCTPQSAKSTLTPLQHSGSSKRDKFIEASWSSEWWKCASTVVGWFKVSLISPPRLPKPCSTTSGWSPARDASILQGATPSKERASAAELIVVSSSARPVYAPSTVPGSAAASLSAATTRTSCSQEALKASATLGGCEHDKQFMSFSFLGLMKYRRLICSQYMRTTSVLFNVSLSISLYCSYLNFSPI